MGANAIGCLIAVARGGRVEPKSLKSVLGGSAVVLRYEIGTFFDPIHGLLYRGNVWTENGASSQTDFTYEGVKEFIMRVSSGRL